MVIALRSMADDAVAEVLGRTAVAFLAELVAAGGDPDDARRHADERVGAAFRDGRAAPGHLFYEIVQQGELCGHLWLGPAPDGKPNHWWLWDIEVAEHVRGRGVGRAAMVLAFDELRTRGATEVGLNVFGNNTVAMRLYDSLGFEVMSMLMRKKL